nr:EthD family reductase [Micromonospora sp. DSM 115978]
DGATFDHDYYRDKHVPLACSTWGVTDVEIDRGIDGPYVAAVHFRFASVEAMQQAMASPDTAAIMADVANYTTIKPVLQTSSVVA